MKTLTKAAWLSAALTLTAAFALPAFAEDFIYLPNLSYRTGPFAATGTPLMDGQRDYMNMLNARDGGINGVKLGYDECETGYSTEKGVECYEKTKDKAIVTQPWSTGITLQVLPKTNVDKIPILAPGYGFSPMADGKVFQWAFNPPATYWDGASMILNSIAGGNLDSLKGKKIAYLYLDAPYGKEPIPLFQDLASQTWLHVHRHPGRRQGNAEPVVAMAADPSRKARLRHHVGLGRHECRCGYAGRQDAFPDGSFLRHLVVRL